MREEVEARIGVGDGGAGEGRPRRPNKERPRRNQGGRRRESGQKSSTFAAKTADSRPLERMEDEILEVELKREAELRQRAELRRTEVETT